MRELGPDLLPVLGVDDRLDHEGDEQDGGRDDQLSERGHLADGQPGDEQPGRRAESHDGDLVHGEPLEQDVGQQVEDDAAEESRQSDALERLDQRVLSRCR